MAYTLYFSPGACSIAPHAALREMNLPFEIVRVDLRAKKTADGGDYLAINPKGYVPALRLPDGQILTENAVILSYLADRTASPVVDRYRLLEWLVFISTELHKGMAPMYSPIANAEYKQAVGERLALRFARLADAVREHPFVLGELTIVDFYAFYVMRAWQKSAKKELSPELQPYYTRLAELPSIAQALAAEGITA